MRTKEKDEELKTLLGSELFNEFLKTVERIETSIPTTKDHYGDYMSFLSNLPTEQRKGISALLIYLGANVDGVANGLNVLR